GGTHEGDIWKARLEVAGDPALAGGGVLDEEGRLIGMLLGQGRETILLHSKDRTRSIEYPLECTGPTEAGWILPVDLIESVADGLIDAGDEGQGFLGVSVEIPRQEAAASRSASSSSGLLVSRVLAGSPAQRCGILPGDRITGLNGQPVTDWNALTQAVAARGPGETIEIDLQRNGKRISMPVRLEDRAHVIWRERQRMLAGGREKRLRGQIEQLTHQLELLRHQLQGQ
ncbi:MAG: S1C family serine protease, partial [Candidatus Eisenbacteria bacterium]|nr:S1C family serine protease [Candidatus Eisenbacteria bacterium]